MLSSRAWIWTAAFLAGLVIVGGWEAWAIPESVFVIHCEPTRANDLMWEELVQLVYDADQHAIPLTIYFTPQWASLILSSSEKVNALETWLELGHEIGCHHHGYWGTKDRGSTWDGYTNTPLSELDPEDRSQFIGTMDDYMILLNALPGSRSSGCMGGGEARDAVDHPCQIVFSTQGNQLDHAISQPTELERNKCAILEIGHGLLVGHGRGALQERYEETSDQDVFGVVGHVYNYAEFPAAFAQWFAFLRSLDPGGDHRHTVSNLLGEVLKSSPK